MSLRRILAVGRLELSQTLRRPMFWILLLLLTLMSWGLSAGNVTIASGDTAVGGDKAWINSESQMTMFVIVLTFLITAFFASVAAGMAVLRDDEVGASEILHTTPLRPAEYVAGKFAGVTVTFLFALTWQLLTLVVFFQLMPIENAAEVRGDFRLGAYLRPMLFFALPNVLFALGTGVQRQTGCCVPEHETAEYKQSAGDLQCLHEMPRNNNRSYQTSQIWQSDLDIVDRLLSRDAFYNLWLRQERLCRPPTSY